MSHVVAVARDAFGEAPLLRGASPHAVEELSASAREVRSRRATGSSARETPPTGSSSCSPAGCRWSRRRRTRAAEVGPGAALGELGLLTGSERSASVRAVRDSRLLALDAESFVRLLEIDGGFALSVARELARQLQASGGLALPETRPSVFAIVSAGSGSAADFAAELAIALERFGSVVALDGGDLARGRLRGRRSSAPRRSSRTFCCSTAPGAWGEFCRRQCDRLLVVAAGTAPPEARDGARRV